jgi:serine/threonine protein kinase
MGDVFLAEQLAPIARTVAIKLIRPGIDCRDVLARFDAERQTLALFDHPGIARIFDAGTTGDGRPFFAMEFVPGKQVTQFADEAKLGIRDRLELFLMICDAVAHAHDRGVIHRDLKPANLLAWTEAGQSRVKVIDFGIATAVGDAPTDAGSQDYTSGDSAVDARTDVFSLGVVLYELLVGQKPFHPPDRRIGRAIRPSDRAKTGADFNAVDRATTTAALVCTLREGLEWIPMKALRLKPRLRYQTVAAMADDVRSYLGGSTSVARPNPALVRLLNSARRHLT